ncbi:PucR family transcriptional regulator [Metabacillus idriensis]|uniref:PucR family transcriptional regulator n=1 Tax=Metabacillus idriensis TaxID=324768 RepID=UPI0017483C37|nr:helix-turn-helix domain-containing protein [Metabacillus idriensis]
MIDKLAAHYREAFSLAYAQDHKDYKWFKTDDGQLFGIKKNKLTEQEDCLLSALYASYETDTGFRENSSSAERWLNYLYGENDPPFIPSSNSIRCYYFYSKHPIIDKQNFEEAMQGSIPTSTILWISLHKGIIIEENSEPIIDKESFNQWIDTFTSDFFIELHVYIGQLQKMNESLKLKIMAEQRCFETIYKSYSRRKCLTFYEALPILNFDKENLITEHSFSEFLAESLEDGELVLTLNVFFECNLNVSLTAKKLYMHRNSVQYRIEKFIEKTGMDIKHFHEAVAAFLALQYKGHC